MSGGRLCTIVSTSQWAHVMHVHSTVAMMLSVNTMAVMGKQQYGSFGF